MAGTVPYLWHRAGDVGAQLDHLQAVLDPITTAELDELGVAPGWRCLEVGAGGGSIAGWLDDRVGVTGHVTATDVRTDHTRVPTAVRLLRHDISREPVPDPGTWDLIHARLVLQHLPDRVAVVDRLVQALRPGGWLLLEDFDCRYLPVVAAPDPESAALYHRVTTAVLDALAGAGADLGWGADAYRVLKAAGLLDIAARTRSSTWDGGTAGCRLHALHTVQLAAELTARGLEPSTLEEFRSLMDDPRFSAQFYLLVSTRGRRG